MARVANAAVIQNKPSGPVPSIPGHGPATRPNMVAVGTMVWLSSELMFFAALFAFYFTIRGHEPQLWAERTAQLNIPFAAANTAILVISSVWCQLGVHQAEHGKAHRSGSLFNVSSWGMREWYVLTYIFGSIFVSDRGAWAVGARIGIRPVDIWKSTAAAPTPASVGPAMASPEPVLRPSALRP